MTLPALQMPAEWAPHSRCWMAWPVRPETFHGGIDEAKEAYAEVAQAIAQFEPVTMVCDQADVAEASLACKGVDVIPMPISDSWLRDNGPSFVRQPDGTLAGVHWRFNAWGRLYPDHQPDAEVGRRLLDKLGLPIIEAPLVMEGGAFHVDGEGTLITTEQCLLNRNRNPDLSRGEIEAHLRAFLGVSRIIWLGEGYDGDETSGHIDEVATFVRPGVLAMAISSDHSDPNYAVCQDNLARLKGVKDARGRDIEVVPLPIPARRDQDGRRLTLSYTNLYIANGGVVMPSFEDSADAEAFRTVRKLFPDREVVQVVATPIVRGGGGIHCITQQQPE